MKSKAFWGGKNRDYAASLKNVVNFLAAQMYDINFYGCFFTCLHMRTKVVVQRLISQCTVSGVIHMGS